MQSIALFLFLNPLLLHFFFHSFYLSFSFKCALPFFFFDPFLFLETLCFSSSSGLLLLLRLKGFWSISFTQEIVNRGNFVVFICFNTLSCVFKIDIEVTKLLKQSLVNLFFMLKVTRAFRMETSKKYRNERVLDINSLWKALDEKRIPWMGFYLRDCESFCWVSCENRLQKISGILRDELRDRKFTTHDFVVQDRRIRILERKIPTNQCEHNDSTTPNIYAYSLVLLARYHFWSSVARWSASCL